MSNNRLNKDMCRYCKYRYMGGALRRYDNITFLGVCSDFDRMEEADMSGCYWKKHPILYSIIKSFLWALPAILVCGLILAIFLALFCPVVFVAIFVSALSIAIIVAMSVGVYCLYRFVRKSVNDFE